ncbi:MmyB family transcriptional regulator [Streptomyces sp. NPDC000941]
MASLLVEYAVRPAATLSGRAKAPVRASTSGDCPEIGEITLDCDVLLVPGEDLRVVTYTAAAGSRDAGKLDLLRVIGGRTTHAHP